MSHKKTKNKKSKKNKRRNLFINILAGFLILLSLALIFNSKIRDIFWYGIPINTKSIKSLRKI